MAPYVYFFLICVFEIPFLQLANFGGEAHYGQKAKSTDGVWDFG